MIALGYLFSFLYIGVVIVFGELVLKFTKIEKEVCRKVEHILTGLSWLIACWFIGPTVHLVIFNALGALLLAVLTFTDIMKSVERENTKKSYGLLYFGISTLIVAAIAVFVNKDFYWFTGISYYCMALGDGMAPLIARLCKKINVKLTSEKSLWGTVTVFAVSSLVAWIFSVVCDLGYSGLFILSVGALAATVEMFSRKCTDNLTLEFFVFGYLVLNYYGYASVALQIAILVALPMAMLNGGTGLLTDNANIVSWGYYVASTFVLGMPIATTVLSLYILSIIVGVIGLKKSNKQEKKKEKLSRTAKQIFANSLMALACCLLYAITSNSIFALAAYVSVVEEFADSMASDIGKMSRKKPVDIIGFKEMPTGISGGVTLLGSVCTLLASGVALAIPFAFGVFAWQTYLILLVVAVIGVFVDSVLGSRLQVLYKCTVCGSLTERVTHCGEEAAYHKGVRRIDNSVVNFFSSVVAVGLALVVLVLL